jgi:hypothetical protein
MSKPKWKRQGGAGRPPFRPEELSERWGLPVQTITLNLRTGRIAGAFRVGKAWLIPPEVVERIERGEGAAS